MSNPNGRVLAVVLERTSGDEGEGQDIEAQMAQTVHRARAAGFDVVSDWPERDVPGDTPWTDPRRLIVEAVGDCRLHGAVLVVREVSRLSRFPPHLGMGLITTLPDLEVLGRAHWSRRGGAWVADDDTAELLRLIDLWDAWREKRKTRERTALAMRDIKEGRRATKSGKPPGRPVLELVPAGLEGARGVLARGGSQNEAVEAYRQASGYYAVKTPEARAARDVSRRALMRALGQNADLGKTHAAPAGNAPVSNGPLVPRPESDQNIAPATSAPARPAEMPAHGQAVSDGGP